MFPPDFSCPEPGLGCFGLLYAGYLAVRQQHVVLCLFHRQAIMDPQQAPQVDQFPIYKSILSSIEAPRLWLKLARSLSKEQKIVWVKLGSGGQGAAYLVKLPLSLGHPFTDLRRSHYPPNRE